MVAKAKIKAAQDTAANEVINIDAKLAATQYNANYKPSEQQVALTVKNKIVGTLGNFITISGQPKARKSTISHAIIASGIVGTAVLDFKLSLPPNKNKIVLLDTEQSRYDFYKSLDRMKALVDAPDLPPWVTAYNTRHFQPNENLAALKSIAATPGVGCIVVDGALDLITDFNDITECKRVIDALKLLTEANGVLVIIVLHQAKTTNFTIGHLGSMADRFSQATLDIIKHEDGVTEVKPKFMRSDEHFEPVCIYYNHNINNYSLHWAAPDYSQKPKTNKK